MNKSNVYDANYILHIKKSDGSLPINKLKYTKTV